MTSECKTAFNKVNELIIKKREELISENSFSNKRSMNLDFWKSISNTDSFQAIKNIDNSNRNIYLGMLPKGTLIENHYHEFNETCVCISGVIQIEIDGEQTLLNSQEHITIPSNTIHSGEVMEDMVYVVIEDYNE